MGTLTDLETQSVDLSLIRSCLQETRLFAGLKDPHITTLCQLCRVVSYEADDVICHEGSVGTELFITLRGQVRVEIRLPREENTTSIYQVGHHEVFGEFALLDGHRRSAGQATRTPTDGDAGRGLGRDHEGHDIGSRADVFRGPPVGSVTRRREDLG